MYHMRSAIFLMAMAAIAASSPVNSDTTDGCASGYTLCAPADATTANVPQIGSADLEALFVDIIDSSLPTWKRHISSRSSASLCCVSSLTCLAMSSLHIPFCYDKFTTNYFLPDGSYGTIVGGAYTAASGDVANLETGDYTLANGTKGNIYANNESAKPNTATLAMPSQYTASGVGSAIPASVLGAVTVTTTTTNPASTVPATTRSASTITTVISGSTVTTVESSTLPSSSESRTISATTVSAVKTTVQSSNSLGISPTSTTVAASATATTTKKSVGMMEIPHRLSILSGLAFCISAWTSL
jgi:hypothetical protein